MMNKYIHPLQQVSQTKQVHSKKRTEENIKFNQILADAQKIKISKHAKERMAYRNISVDEATWSKLNDKMIEAKQKGITDAVVVTDDASFIVSTKNNTIITALNKDEATNQIFTNINGTIIL